MDSRPDPASLMTQEQMFFNSIDTTDNGRSFFPSNAPGMSLTQDDFMRQQDGSMEDCCDPHQYMPPTPSSPLPFPPVFSQGMTNQRQQITSVSSSEGNCPRPFQHSPYHDNQVSSSFSMNQGHLYNRAQLPTVPTSKQFSGEYNFEISFGPPTDSAPKSATWTYSTKTSKLYTNIGSYCPFQFKTNGKPLHRAAYIRAVAMFKGSSNLHDIVKMCPNHAETSSEDPSIRNNFFIRSNNANAVYLECPQTGRHSVIVPYSGPQAGTNYVTEMFSFKCFSSCASGHGRKPIEIIFTLEDTDSGSILGRCVVEIRVCACPGRDRRSDELNQEKSLFPSNGSKRALKQKNINRKKVKKATQEEYTITTSHKDIHDVLMNIKLALEGRFYSKSEIDDDDESGNSSAKRAQPSSQTATTSRETNSDNKPGYSSCM